MIKELKNLIQKNDTEGSIAYIRQNPDVLDIQDENGTSGLTLIAYSLGGEVLSAAIQLKKTFSFSESIVCGKREVTENYLSTSGPELVNKHSDDGFTPLSLAAYFNQNAIAKLLIDHGADPNLAATNPSKVNALHSAVAKDNLELCKLFVNTGADVNLAQTQNVTPLHSAAHRGNLEIVRLLVENGARVHDKMTNGDNALLLAQRDGHQEVVDYLTSKSQAGQ